MTASNLTGFAQNSVSQAIAESTQKSAFGAAVTVDPTPVVQILGTNGLTEKIIDSSSGSGSVAASNGLFVVSSGISSFSFCSLQTGVIPYKGGEGARGEYTASFTVGVASSIQLAGFVSSTDSLAFGYVNDVYGIIYRRFGRNEIRTITVTAGASGAETATVTISGTAYAVPVTAGTTSHNAFEIAVWLDANVPGWNARSIESVVTIDSDVARPYSGTYSFTSTGTCAATIAQVTAGAQAEPEFIAQADWNRCKADWIDPQKLNVYRITYQYLGAGDVFFYVENKSSGLFELVHVIEYAGTSETPSISDPNMRLGLTAASLGSTTNLVVKSACMAGFIDGKNVFTHEPHAIPVYLASASTSFVNMLTIRNKRTRAGKANRIYIHIVGVRATTLSAKGAEIRVIRNGTITGDMIFYDYDASHSIIDYSTSAVSVTGNIADSYLLAPNGSISIDSGILFTLDQGEYISFTGAVLASPNAAIYLNVKLQEDM